MGRLEGWLFKTRRSSFPSRKPFVADLADNFKYTHASSIAFPHDVVNVVPADFNGDGRLDLLAMMTEGANGGGWWGTPGAMRTDMRVVLGGPGGLGEFRLGMEYV